MALLPDDPGGVQPRIRRLIQLAGMVLSGDIDLETYVATNFSIEVGSGIPTHALPGALTHGIYLRSGGISLNAVIYVTIDAGTTWTPMSIP